MKIFKVEIELKDTGNPQYQATNLKEDIERELAKLVDLEISSLIVKEIPSKANPHNAS